MWVNFTRKQPVYGGEHVEAKCFNLGTGVNGLIWTITAMSIFFFAWVHAEGLAERWTNDAIRAYEIEQRKNYIAQNKSPITYTFTEELLDKVYEPTPVKEDKKEKPKAVVKKEEEPTDIITLLERELLNPEAWTLGEYTLDHKEKGVSLWVSGGKDRFKTYQNSTLESEGANIQFSEQERNRLWAAFMKSKRRIEEIARHKALNAWFKKEG